MHSDLCKNFAQKKKILATPGLLLIHATSTSPSPFLSPSLSFPYSTCFFFSVAHCSSRDGPWTWQGERGATILPLRTLSRMLGLWCTFYYLFDWHWKYWIDKIFKIIKTWGKRYVKCFNYVSQSIILILTTKLLKFL